MNLKLNLVKRDNAIIGKEISINKVLSHRKNPRGIGLVLSSARLSKETNIEKKGYKPVQNLND